MNIRDHQEKNVVTTEETKKLNSICHRNRSQWSCKATTIIIFDKKITKRVKITLPNQDFQILSKIASAISPKTQTSNRERRIRQSKQQISLWDRTKETKLMLPLLRNTWH